MQSLRSAVNTAAVDVGSSTGAFAMHEVPIASRSAAIRPGASTAYDRHAVVSSAAQQQPGTKRGLDKQSAGSPAVDSKRQHVDHISALPAQISR